VGELVPKRIPLTNPERYATALAPVMRFLAKIGSPAVKFLSRSTELVVRFLPVKLEQQQTVTEEDIRHMIEQGTQTGTFEEAEQDMLEGVFRLGDRRVAELMTPRQEMAWIDLEDPVDRIRELLRLNSYSRFPVAVGDLD